MSVRFCHLWHFSYMQLKIFSVFFWQPATNKAPTTVFLSGMCWCRPGTGSFFELGALLTVTGHCYIAYQTKSLYWNTVILLPSATYSINYKILHHLVIAYTRWSENLLLLSDQGPWDTSKIFRTFTNGINWKSYCVLSEIYLWLWGLGHWVLILSKAFSRYTFGINLKLLFHLILELPNSQTQCPRRLPTLLRGKGIMSKIFKKPRELLLTTTFKKFNSGTWK